MYPKSQKNHSALILGLYANSKGHWLSAPLLFLNDKAEKSKPNKYKISTVNFTVNMTVDMGVHVGVDVSNINRLRQEKDIYINLFKKYKKQIEAKHNILRFN